MTVQKINWRSEFGMLEPYIAERGGVVHVRYRGDVCAPDAFLATLKSVFEECETTRPRASVRIDPDFFTTHYLGDVLHAFADKLDCTLEAPKSVAPVIEEFVVASGNESEGDMDVTANIHMHTSDYSDAPALRNRRVAIVCNAMRKFLATGRFMIVLNDAPARDQAPFWRDLWEKGLKELVDDGLFLVKMIDEDKQQQGKHPDEPKPEQTAALPIEFDETRQRDAIEDLAKILIHEVKRIKNLEGPLETATQSVRAFVYSHKRSISRLHTEWSGVLMQLVRDAR